MRTLALLLALATTAAAGPGDDLAAKLNAAQNGTAFVRLKLTVEDPPGNTTTSLQIQIKASHTPQDSHVLHQVLYPKDRKGESVLITRAGDTAPTGHHAAPDGTLTPLSTADLEKGLFGSDLAYTDTIENFFTWNTQIIIGEDTVDRQKCQILESRPGPGQSTPYAAVRSWVDTDRLVPLRVEKLDPSGQIVRRIDTTRVHKKLSGENIPASFMVRRPGGTSITTLQGSRSKTDVVYPPTTFTPKNITDLSPPKG